MLLISGLGTESIWRVVERNLSDSLERREGRGAERPSVRHEEGHRDPDCDDARAHEDRRSQSVHVVLRREVAAARREDAPKMRDPKDASQFTEGGVGARGDTLEVLGHRTEHERRNGNEEQSSCRVPPR